MVRPTLVLSRLPLAKAFKFVHGALHILASRVSRGADALDAEAEVVRVRGAQDRFFERDEVARVQIKERLIKGLHAVLASAGGNGLTDQARLVGVDDAIADIAGRDHHFDGRNAALAVAPAHEALADDSLERGSELQSH